MRPSTRRTAPCRSFWLSDRWAVLLARHSLPWRQLPHPAIPRQKTQGYRPMLSIENTHAKADARQEKRIAVTLGAA
jgi:hypothetical protein